MSAAATVEEVQQESGDERDVSDVSSGPDTDGGANSDHLSLSSATDSPLSLDSDDDCNEGEGEGEEDKELEEEEEEDGNEDEEEEEEDNPKAFGQAGEPTRRTYHLRGRSKVTTPASDEAACGRSLDGKHDLDNQDQSLDTDGQAIISKDPVPSTALANAAAAAAACARPPSGSVPAGVSNVNAVTCAMLPNALLPSYQPCAPSPMPAVHNSQMAESARLAATTFPLYATNANMAADAFLATGAYTRARAAKIKATAAIHSQLQVTAATGGAPGQQGAGLCAMATPSQLLATGMHGMRPIDPTAHPYMINPYLPRAAAMDLKASGGGTAAMTTPGMNAARLVGAPYPHAAATSLNLDDVSQYWSPSGSEMTGLPLFAGNSFPSATATHYHANLGQYHHHQKAMPVCRSAPGAVPVQPPAALPSTSAAASLRLPGSLPTHANTAGRCQNTGSSHSHGHRTSGGGSNINKSRASNGSSIAAAAHSTTHLVTRSSNRRGSSKSSSHHHKSSTREPGSMSKAERRRNKASVRERKRVVSLNDAFLNLKRAMPFVPPDTKLSKIKTLRFAIRYVKRMMDMLSESGDKHGGAANHGTYSSERMDVFDPCGCFGSAYGAPFDDFDLEMDFSTSSQPTLPDVPITINDSDLEN